MIERLDLLPDEVLYLSITQPRLRIVRHALRLRVRRRLDQALAETDSADEGVDVERVGQVGGVNGGWREWVGGRDVHGTTGEGVQEADHDCVVVRPRVGFEVGRDREEAGNLEESGHVME